MNKDESVGYLVNLMARLFANALAAAILPHGTMPGQFPILLALWEEEGLTQGDLHRRLAIEQPTVANTLKRMERDGLIERHPDPEDQRKTRIFLTDKARKLEQPLKERAMAINAKALSALTPAEAASYLDMTRRIIASIGKSA